MRETSWIQSTSWLRRIGDDKKRKAKSGMVKNPDLQELTTPPQHESHTHLRERNDTI
jgi:hypothetical protein